MNVSSWLKQAVKNIDRLDAELILASTLHQDRIFLHAHPEFELNEEQQELANAQALRRQKAEPLAYILGYKEFYGRNFTVTPDVLIPRPETEAIIDIVKNYLKAEKPAEHNLANTVKILDVGTGSGCIALTLFEELKQSYSVAITASDISSKALACAEYNAEKLENKSISLIKSNLLKSKQFKGKKFDIITANLPYVDKAWPWISKEALSYEPKIALYCADYGMKLIKELLEQATTHLEHEGILVLEADISQRQKILDYVAEENLPYTEYIEDDLIFDQSQSSPSRQSLALALQFHQNV